MIVIKVKMAAIEILLQLHCNKTTKAKHLNL
jgi:hypothetical protein